MLDRTIVSGYMVGHIFKQPDILWGYKNKLMDLLIFGKYIKKKYISIKIFAVKTFAIFI